ncbi:DUF3307 domain-containing protein [Roseovarius sp. MMSF_3281]|uniref:DUF3307 domain-containing protein n=1 Tax=Roseovarius sp. MMSF_3281 TaxID=3046694 RepID=UPI00273F2B78|nr:DUF3307 domain-containing protein [Roseovarius sp. MMSF_3281]
MIAVTFDMMAGFAALLLAHVLADFTCQTKGMVANKRHAGVFTLHIGIVFGLSLAALGGALHVAAAVAGAHMLIDGIKTYVLPEGWRGTFTAFALDQLAHLASLAAAVVIWPGAVANGLWAPWLDLLVGPAVILSGLILTVIAGGYAVGLITAPYAKAFKAQGLENAGQMIGRLERAVIFLLIAMGEPAGIGFLIAAKSLLRFEATKEQKASEYVIIGTLTSFGWALGISTASMALFRLVAAS